MATPTPTADATLPSASSSPAQKTCWICLENEAETPGTTWCKPCPCSLDGHESCVLQWVAEEEAEASSGRTVPKSGGMKCPQCKAPIFIDEPYDAVIAIRNRWARIYNQASPFILVAIMGGGGIAGSAAYGSAVSMLVVGPTTFKRWLGPFPAALHQAAKLSLVGPGLVLARFLGTLGNMITLPIGMVGVCILLAHENYLTWPPTMEWAISLFPVVQFTYSIVYSEIFGKFERRLNGVLKRGRLITDEQNGQQQALPAPNNNGAQEPPQEEEGIWDSIVDVGRAVVGLFDDEDRQGAEAGNDGQAGRAGGVDAEVLLDFEVNLGGGGGGDDDEEAEAREEFHQLLDQVAVELAPPRAPAAAQPAQQGQQRVAQQQQQQQRQQRQQQQQQQQAAQNQPRRNDMYEPSYFSSIFSHMVTSLLLPAISCGMGEAIRHVVPKIWRGRTGASIFSVGLLSERWRRSLVGGCLFVVLKDAFALFLKYRRVQVKLNRKIRNVEKRVGGGGIS
ncbi:hypothetical protein QBC44DRAFT_353507 [Cladorrhinum sp. PSN332]|nr:hypothetical protein QBC44DRAFT_353507 [Cladorrhinum sp. PSN332]